jgi:hypothetical protein
MEVRMKKILIAGLFTAIGTFAMISQAGATSRYCFANPDDPRCYEPDYYGDNDYPPSYRDQDSYGDDGTFYRRRQPTFELQFATPPRNSCKGIAKSLRRSGFKLPYAIDCSGRDYTYVAYRDGQRLKVIVASRTGRIRSIRPY